MFRSSTCRPQWVGETLMKGLPEPTGGPLTDGGPSCPARAGAAGSGYQSDGSHE